MDSRRETLRCYHLFPRHYTHIDEMIAQLPAIADMGFNAVWVGPLHPVSEEANEHGHRGSLYAMTDAWKWRHDFFGTDDVEAQKSKIRELTGKAKALGMRPMFDLVLKHMGKGALLERGEDAYLKHIGIDTPEWFDKGAVSGGGGQSWTDVVPFDYDKPAVSEAVIRHLWDPFIRMYMSSPEAEPAGLGFEGFRLDAAHHIHPGVVREIVNIAHDACRKSHGKDPVILAEILGDMHREDKIAGLRSPTQDSCGISHVVNHAFCLPNRYMPPYRSMTEEEFQHKCHEEFAGFSGQTRGLVLQVVRLAQDGSLRPTVGGTVGFADYHDQHESLPAMLRAQGIDDPVEIAKALREHIANAAFFSDGGWFALTGIEEADERKRSVCEHAVNTHPRKTNADLRPFIRQVNDILAKQPPLGLCSWSERLFLPGRPELAIYNLHDRAEMGSGIGRDYLRIVNTDPTKTVALGAEEIDRLAAMTGRHPNDFQMLDMETNGIGLVGDVVLPVRRTDFSHQVPPQPFTGKLALLVDRAVGRQ